MSPLFKKMLLLILMWAAGLSVGVNVGMGLQKKHADFWQSSTKAAQETTQLVLVAAKNAQANTDKCIKELKIISGGGSSP